MTPFPNTCAREHPPAALQVVNVAGSTVSLRCPTCREFSCWSLPSIRKRLIYLDQSYLSHVFKGKDSRYDATASLLRELAALQVVACPYSATHEEEIALHIEAERERLRGFIKDFSRGHEFRHPTVVREHQHFRAFARFLRGHPPESGVHVEDAVPSAIHEWDGLFRVDIKRPMGDLSEARKIKGEIMDRLLKASETWRMQPFDFESAVQEELGGLADLYLAESKAHAIRSMTDESGDWILEEPYGATFVRKLVMIAHEGYPDAPPLHLVMGYLKASRHFREVPFEDISVRIFCELRRRLSIGQHSNPDRLADLLRGLSRDIEHIATFAPYVEAMFVDKVMAEYLNDSRINLTNRYGTKVFSVKTLKDFEAYLQGIREGVTQEHRELVAAVYGGLRAGFR